MHEAQISDEASPYFYKKLIRPVKATVVQEDVKTPPPKLAHRPSQACR